MVALPVRAKTRALARMQTLVGSSWSLSCGTVQVACAALFRLVHAVPDIGSFARSDLLIHSPCESTDCARDGTGNDNVTTTSVSAARTRVVTVAFSYQHPRRPRARLVGECTPFTGGPRPFTASAV